MLGGQTNIHRCRGQVKTKDSSHAWRDRNTLPSPAHWITDLTANVYTDPKLLDIAGALEALPLLPLGDEAITQTARATGTTGDATMTAGAELQETAPSLVPTLVPKTSKPSILGATVDKMTGPVMTSTRDQAIAVSACNVNDKAPADMSCQSGAFKAGDGTRTRNSQLGRLALYH